MREADRARHRATVRRRVDTERLAWGLVAEGRTAHLHDQRHKALESVLEALDMEHTHIPSTKANPIELEAFYAEILVALAGRVAALEHRPAKGYTLK